MHTSILAAWKTCAMANSGLTSSNTHGTGSQGSQLFAYDMIVAVWDSAAKQPNRLLPGKNGSKNDHYRIWGKPIHAMADGTVAHFLDGVGANYFPGTGNDAGPWKEAPWDTSTQAGKDKSWTDHVGAGNHFYIRHGEELVLYAHMQSGTLPQKFLKKDAVVKAGDLLGLAGNAGSSSEPHTHIHAIKGTVAESGPCGRCYSAICSPSIPASSRPITPGLGSAWTCKARRSCLPPTRSSGRSSGAPNGGAGKTLATR